MCAARPFDSGEGRCLVGRGDPKVPLRRTTGLVGRGCPEIPTKSPECGQLDAAMSEVKLQPEGKVRGKRDHFVNLEADKWGHRTAGEHVIKGVS